MTTSSGGADSNQLDGTHAYIALGSNLGDRVANIERACQELDRDGLTVTRTSALYETEPMYYADQDRFVNGVCEIRPLASISPLQLLRQLQSIEQRMGRKKVIDKGPRNIDLDILLYGQQTYESPELNVPHKDMLEREFVLRPLRDLIPNASHPSFPGFSYSRRLNQLQAQKNSSPTPTISMLSDRIPRLVPSLATRSTQIMGILNLTPDSFSDGGANPLDPHKLLPTCQSMRTAGATILDIGGQSTRPRAPLVDAEEELSRVLPIITLLRSLPEFNNIAISIDTFRASVARAAITAGADIVNDVSAGTLDSAMLPTVGELGCGIVLMHMRGDPSSMVHQTDYSRYGGVLPGVAVELAERVAAAERAGIRRWRIALDPGIGFAKNVGQNLELLQNLAVLRNRREFNGFPWLVGPSRKGFIGNITGVAEAKDRTWGTAAAVTAAVHGGADIVRVHDTLQMKQVVTMADAIWRVDVKSAAVDA